MTNDLVYAFDKKTKLGTSLGEISSKFNMSFVIDGTKDSAKVIVWNYDGAEIEPNTIIFHKNTTTWWVVSNDKVERDYNENGFVYIHELDLLGAIELFNARDLTDCGFNQDTYTIRQFITRLVSLSNLEYDFDTNNVPTNLLDKKVGFVKTFENYTLLSAIRELLDAYNVCPKLEFSTSYDSVNDRYTIVEALLNILPKTGNYSLPTHLGSDFDDIKETKTMSKESFGACVVSNAENVISTKAKTYPSMGAIPVRGLEYKTDASNAVIRLPSKVFKVNWIKLVNPSFDTTVTFLNQTVNIHSFRNTAYNVAEQNVFLDNLLSFFLAHGMTENEFDNIKETIIERLKNYTSFTFYGDSVYDAVEDKIYSLNGHKIPEMQTNLQGNPFKKIALFDNETRALLNRKWQGIYWQRGSNLIRGFDFADNSMGNNIIFSNRDYTVEDENEANTIFSVTINGTTYKINAPTPAYFYLYDYKIAGNRYGMRFVVNYIPMSDIKIKVDNTQNKQDIKLYNQNGKLTDSVALSKLVNSYSKEIGSDTITKYRQDYSFDDCPKISSVVFVDGVPYVINNISLDFAYNEENGDMGYFINGEYTMSKYFSTKSLMVNPNTNIRDYGIPQNFNVRRKQLYRDYYELAYETYDDANNETAYLGWREVFNLTKATKEEESYIAFLKIGAEYTTFESGSAENVPYAYFQLETTEYILDKMLYIMVDFYDNNIIGYDNQSVYSGFDLNNIITPEKANINTPISFVDDKGTFESIEILFASSQNILDANQSADYGTKVFIDSTLYEAIKNNSYYVMSINEPLYKKDALEVPVFEYALQIDDSKDVLIGDNILTQHENCLYFYSYVSGDNLTQENCVPDTTITHTGTSYVLNKACQFDLSSQPGTNTTMLNVYQKANVVFNASTLSWSYGANMNVTPNRDLAVFRHALNVNTGEIIIDLMFIAKNVPLDHVSNNRLTLEINHYKLN